MRQAKVNVEHHLPTHIVEHTLPTHIGGVHGGPEERGLESDDCHPHKRRVYRRRGTGVRR